jgi:hypothetical protein
VDCKGADKGVIKKLCKQFKTIVLSKQCSPLSLRRLEPAADLMAIIEKVERRKIKHLQKGGKIAHICVGCFHFNKKRTMTAGAGGLPMGLDTPLLTDTQYILFSEPLVMTIGGNTVDIMLASLHDSMHISCNLGPDGLHFSPKASRSCPTGVYVDVQSVNTDSLYLQMRHTVIKSAYQQPHEPSLHPSRWFLETGTGVYSRNGTRSAAEETLSGGLLCVLLVHDSPPAP